MVDYSFKEECIRMIVHVIVDIDIRIGLFEIIYILYGDKIHTRVSKCVILMHLTSYIWKYFLRISIVF